MVTNGRIDSLMPAFASLSDAERWDVVAYALSLSSPAADAASGKALYAAENACAQCHGDEQGAGSSGPSFLVSGLVEQRSLVDLAQAIRAGSPPAMPAYGEQLTDDQVWALAHLRPLAGMEQRGHRGAVHTGGAAERSIGGLVSNGTPGAPLPHGVEVILTGFDGEQEVYSETAAAVGSDGTYAFADVPAVGPHLWRHGLLRDVLYFSDGAHLAGDASPWICRSPSTTQRPMGPACSVERLHLLFDFVDPGPRCRCSSCGCSRTAPTGPLWPLRSGRG